MAIDLFNYLTTYNSDYRARKPIISSSNECEKYDIAEENYKKMLKQKKIPQMDMETMCKYSEKAFVPFDTYYRKKETVNTNPADKFINYEPEEVSHESQRIFRQNQPKVFMVPQICLNNLPEEVMYSKGGLIDNIYTSDWKKAQEITASKPKELQKMNTVLQTHGEPVSFKNSNECLPLDYKLYSQVGKWDKERIRAGSNINPTDLFWKKKNYAKLYKPTMNKILTTEESNNLKSLIKNDKISLYYDIITPGYSGFVPMLAVGVNPERALHKKNDPLVSEYMRFAGDYKK